MARIKTIDGEWNTVIESKSEIDKMMLDTTSILKLNMKVSITSYKGGFENTRQENEPVTFLKNNILYYS